MKPVTHVACEHGHAIALDHDTRQPFPCAECEASVRGLRSARSNVMDALTFGRGYRVDPLVAPGTGYVFPDDAEVEAAQAKALATGPTRIKATEWGTVFDGPQNPGSVTIRPRSHNVEIELSHALVLQLADVVRRAQMLEADARSAALSQSNPTIPGKIALVEQFLDEDLLCEDA